MEPMRLPQAPKDSDLDRVMRSLEKAHSTGPNLLHEVMMRLRSDRIRHCGMTPDWWPSGMVGLLVDSVLILVLMPEFAGWIGLWAHAVRYANKREFDGVVVVATLPMPANWDDCRRRPIRYVQVSQTLCI